MHRSTLPFNNQIVVSIDKLSKNDIGYMCIAAI